MAYARLEPFGEERDDLRAGIIAATIANAHRAKHARAFKPQDFMPSRERPKASAAALSERIKAAFASRRSK